MKRSIIPTSQENYNYHTVRYIDIELIKRLGYNPILLELYKIGRYISKSNYNNKCRIDVCYKAMMNGYDKFNGKHKMSYNARRI